MGIFRKLLRQKRIPPLDRAAAPELVGSVPLSAAWTLAKGRVDGIDASARLLFITSGLDLDAAGRSRAWEFRFHLPQVGAILWLSLEADPESEDIDQAAWIITQRSQPETESDSALPSLPLPFRDSSDAVAELAAAGVDFVAGPTDLKLESEVLSDGSACWVVRLRDDERRVPLKSE